MSRSRELVTCLLDNVLQVQCSNEFMLRSWNMLRASKHDNNTASADIRVRGWQLLQQYTCSIVSHQPLHSSTLRYCSSLNISPWQRGLSDRGNGLIGRVAFLFFHKLFKHSFLSLFVVLPYKFYKQFNIYNNVRVPPA